MGGDKSGSGDWTQLATSIGGAVAGTMVGGPAGGAMGWQLGSEGGKLLSGATGMESSGKGIAGTGQNIGNMGSTAIGIGSAASGAMSAGKAATPAADATKGFSGITSYGDTAKDVGGTNAWGQALGAGKGNPTIPTESGFGKLNELIINSMDTMGAIAKPQEDAAQSNLQPMTMTASPQMTSPTMLSQVLSAQLMNPAAQNRLAYMHPGRM